jgi:hypothetical protein
MVRGGQGYCRQAFAEPAHHFCHTGYQQKQAVTRIQMKDGRNSRNNGENTRKRIPPIEHQFKPGNPGRPKGARNKLGEAFIADLFATWQRRGVSAIERVIDEKPEAYLKVIASLLPKNVNLNHGHLDDLSDDQLLRKLAVLTEMAKPLLARLPAIIDAAPVGADVGAETNTEGKCV